MIDIIKTDLLKSPELTGIWEKKLREIEDGHYNPALFMEELKHQLRDITDNVRDNFIPSITVTVTGNYPKPKARYGTRTSGKGRYRKKR